MEIKTLYQNLSKKHNLPDYDKLNNDFEIFSIEHTEFLLREIRRKISEKVESYIKTLTGVMQADSSFADMYEASALTEQEHESAFKLFKRLMNLDRYSIEISIDETDEKTAEFIKNIEKEWPKLKKEFKSIVNKLKTNWLKEIRVKTDTGYMG